MPDITASQNFPPIATEDLAKFGVEPRLIPLAVSTVLRVEQSSNGSVPLSPAQAEDLVETFDKVLSSPIVNPILKDRCFRVLHKVSFSHEVLPKSYFPTGVTLSDTIHASGRFADVWKGELEGNQVCVAALRDHPAEDLKRTKRRFYREAVAWKYISHPNVLPFLGVSESLSPFCIVSPWLPNGTIVQYIKNNREIDRLQLLAQAASGLERLHSLGIVHNGINPGNILITEEGVACLQIGIYWTIRSHADDAVGQSSTEPWLRYLAPELLDPSEAALMGRTPPKESDVYSLAMTAYEILTETLPYGGRRDSVIASNIVSGERPPRQTHARLLSDQIWDMIVACWSEERGRRWGIRAVRNQFLVSSAQETVEIEQDVQTTGTLNAIEDTPPKDLPPEPLSVQAEDNSEKSPLDLSPPPVLPPAPTDCFSRDEVLDEVLDLTDQVASTALFGSIGVGKSCVALTLLHHNRTKTKFGRNRHFMPCGNLTNSLEDFLERLSEAIGISRAADIGQLRAHLESSPPLILLLDGVDLILDSGDEEISAMIEELGSYEHVCLVTTCRMYPDIHGFHRVEVPTLSEDGAREAFYNLCALGRSSAVDNLIRNLDFHPLPLNLLASSARENNWDATMLLKAWDDNQANELQTNYQQRLKDVVEISFRSPTIQNLGTTARGVLVGIAAFPNGIGEGRLESTLPSITEVGAAVDVLCKFSLLYRQDGHVKMLSPLRSYFLDSAFSSPQHPETIPWDASCNPAKAWPPVYTAGPPKCKPPKMTKPSTLPLNVNRSLIPRSIKKFLALLCLAGKPVDLGDVCAIPEDTQSIAPVQPGPSVVVEGYNL